MRIASRSCAPRSTARPVISCSIKNSLNARLDELMRRQSVIESRATALNDLADCERLPAFHLIERGFEEPKRGTDARLPPAIAALRTGRRLATWLCPRPDRAGGRRIHTAARSLRKQSACDPQCASPTRA